MCEQKDKIDMTNALSEHVLRKISSWEHYRILEPQKLNMYKHVLLCNGQKKEKELYIYAHIIQYCNIIRPLL